MDDHLPVPLDSFYFTLEMQVKIAFGISHPSLSPCLHCNIPFFVISYSDDRNSLFWLLISLLTLLQASSSYAGRSFNTVTQTSFLTSIETYNLSQLTRMAYHTYSLSRFTSHSLSSPLTCTLAFLPQGLCLCYSLHYFTLRSAPRKLPLPGLSNRLFVSPNKSLS